MDGSLLGLQCVTPAITLLGVRRQRSKLPGLPSLLVSVWMIERHFLRKVNLTSFENYCCLFTTFGFSMASILQCQATMDGGYLTLVAALGGAALGGFTSFATSWTTMRVQMKAQGNASSKTRRRKLYKSFISSASRLHGDALISDKPELSGLIDLHAQVSLMRVNSTTPVIENAVKVVRIITETYSQPNKSPEEIEAMIENGSVDLLRAFSQACRMELE